MSTNRGKDFENIVRSSISNLGIDITRLYDSTSGYISIHTTCDFIAYKYPTIYYIECKSIDGNTLSIATLRQLEDLLEKKKTSLKKGLKSKTGNLFDAYIVLKPDFSV